MIMMGDVMSVRYVSRDSQLDESSINSMATWRSRRLAILTGTVFVLIVGSVRRASVG